jgi:DNA-binding NtrC family response regulator
METILLVEGDPLEACALSSLLAEDYAILHCPELGRAPEEARRSAPALVVLGLPAKCAQRRELIRKTARECKGAPLLVISDEASPAIIVECLRSGAIDFIAKPYCRCDLLRSVGEAIHPLTRRDGCAFPFIGSSPAIKKVEELIRLFADAPYPDPVLILGESGTGKEVAARSLRDLSDSSKSGPFVARNCAAIPESIAESELFGTERGAFTNAISRPGAFELAAGGLVFLDEIGAASLAVQAKLLRVLETGEFWRLAGRKSVEAKFRFVSATDRDLGQAVAEGSFRADLLYRINTLVVEMPPLRSRREDIGDLASHFALDASGGRAGIGADAMEKLLDYDWPGNIRELRNVVHRALAFAGRADEIRAEHVWF